MTTAASRYQQKAQALAQAWAAVRPTFVLARNALVLLLAVGELETSLGDWDCSHNWGGIMKRPLTLDEQSVLDDRGITPSSPNALASARAALPPGPNEILRVDSAPPPKGAYFVWSWAWPNDVQGAEQFVKVLVNHRPGVAAVLDQGSAQDLASAMYASHYYVGTSSSAAANVAGYAAAITKYAPAIDAALPASLPIAPPTPAPPAAIGPTTLLIVPRRNPGNALAFFILTSLVLSQLAPAPAPRRGAA
jgi:hypothetical protein